MTIFNQDINLVLKKRWQRHLFFWSFYILIMTLIHGSSVGEGYYIPWLLNYLAELPVILGLCYSAGLYLNDRLLGKGRFLSYVAAAGLSLLFFSWINVLLDAYLIRPYFFMLDADKYTFGFREVIVNAFGLVYPLVIFIFFRSAGAYYKMHASGEMSGQMQVMEEMARIRSQVHPMFLRNALQNLYIVSRKKKEMVPGMVMSISEILNYLIFECNRDFLRMDREMEIVKKYLDYEKLNLGKKFKYQITIDDHTGRSMITSHVIFPLVRGIFGYPCNEGRQEMLIQAFAQGEGIKIQIGKSMPDSDGLLSDTAWKEEITLAHRRMDLVYRHGFSLSLSEKEKQVQVELYIEPKTVLMENTANDHQNLRDAESRIEKQKPG